MAVRRLWVEAEAVKAWKRWAAYRGYHRCAGCGEMAYCGRAARTRRWLCVECWDEEQ